MDDLMRPLQTSRLMPRAPPTRQSGRQHYASYSQSQAQSGRVRRQRPAQLCHSRDPKVEYTGQAGLGSIVSGITACPHTWRSSDSAAGYAGAPPPLTRSLSQAPA
jgi:hypothetical protein